jgi:hypothetical protein
MLIIVSAAYRERGGESRNVTCWDSSKEIMVKPLLLGLLIAGFSFGQTLSVGVLGGAPFTDVVHNGNVNSVTSIVNSSNFTIGPSVQLNLPLGLRVEVDALYRPYGFKLGVSSSPNSIATSVSASQWRFPLMLQYRFNFPIVKPFLEVGPSFEHLSGISSIASSITGPGRLLHSSDAGIVLGGGVDVKIPLVRLSGELRYTRQTVSNFSDISNLNQAEVLFGIHF